jgi:hypothetical protein
VAIVMAVTGVSCTGGLARQVTTTSPVLPGGSSSPSPGSSPASTEAQILARVSLDPDELQPGFAVGLITGGDQVEGEVTLDLCSATFPSESLRRNRLQLAAVDQSGNGLGLSTEAVLYKDEAATAQGFDELRSARDKCPENRFVQSSAPGVPPLKYRFEDRPDTDWPDVPGVTRLAFAFTITDEQGNAEHVVTAFLRRGRLLVGIYAFGDVPDAVLSPDVGGTEGLVERVAQRMTDVPSSVVSASVP